MSNMSNTVRDAAKDIKDTVKESGQAASAGAHEIQADLEALRRDVAHLAQEIANILAGKGNAAWGRAKSNLDGVISDAAEKGNEAVSAAREVSDHITDAIDESLKQRPYTTLALVAGLGFLLGATWRR
jgi:ElaB/YqjD/DUF883 family membrane-anchored ribosome-binding protein